MAELIKLYLEQRDKMSEEERQIVLKTLSIVISSKEHYVETISSN